MKLLFWDIAEPADRIILCVIAMIPILSVILSVSASGRRAKDVTQGVTHYVSGRLQGRYVSFWPYVAHQVCCWLLIILACVIVISALHIVMRWFRKHNSR